MQPTSKNTPIKVIAGIVVIALAGLGLWQINKNQTPKAEAPAASDTASTTTEETLIVTNRKYKDGTYSSTGNYTSPAGNEEIFITLTIKDDVVTGATFEGYAKNPGSIKLQEAFKNGFSEEVIGKSVDSISLNVINGSSLTPKGFMDALVKIKAQAQA